ncbi:MAG: nucleoside triphosphate pyrophosphohydrolase [Desulfovermiculus sp.]|nr:nucleoside triphosphate pyrophosphohydrolase [Desulfovermiculus sp.]
MTDNSPQAVLEVINTLLGPQGCPWDKEQTPESLGDYILEETFELVDAVRRGAPGREMAEELGDVFFLLFFLTRLLQDREQIPDLQDVWAANAGKMKDRHPHVFADIQCTSREDLHQKWEEVKRQEKGNTDATEYARTSVGSIPASLPPLLRAYRLHAKAAKAGFTWESDQEQKAALEKECNELRQALASGQQDRLEEEFGDILFSLVEYGRRRGVKANAALHKANLKFIRRYVAMLDFAREKGLDWSSLTMQEKDALWEEVKKKESAAGSR